MDFKKQNLVSFRTILRIIFRIIFFRTKRAHITKIILIQFRYKLDQLIEEISLNKITVIFE